MFASPAHLFAELPWAAVQGLADAAAPPGPSSVAFTAIRFVMYAALLGLIGASLFVLLLLRRLRALGLGSDQFAEDAAAAARRLGLVCAAVLMLAAPARLIAQAVSLDVSVGVVLGAAWGRAWMAQMAGAVAAVAALIGVRTIALPRWRIAGVGAAAIAAGFALSGHAASAPRWSSLSIIADLTHLLAGGAWIGTLAAVALAGIPAAMRAPEGSRGSIAAALVRTFSPLGLASFAALAVTGTFAAWEHLGAFAPLFTSEYGQALLWKLGAVAAVAALGALNAWVLAPRLGSEQAARGIRRSAMRELVVALWVILITAVLVAKPTPDETAASSAGPTAPLTTSLLPR